MSVKNASKHVVYLKGPNDGPCVVIAGCMHGDEVIGGDILDWLADHLQPGHIHGEIRLIFGNPVAHTAGKRFIDTDLNRLFTADKLNRISALPDAQRNVEEKRAMELCSIFDGADHLLDIHATGKPTKYPFMYVANTAAHLAEAKLFSAPVIVCEDTTTSMSDGPTDTYIDRQGGRGITYEAGWIGDTGLFDRVRGDVMRYLNYIGACPNNDYPALNNNPQVLKIYEEMIASSDDYTFAREFPNMHEFYKDDLIAVDNGREIRADRDCVLIFPKRVIQKGKETGYLATKES